MRELGSLALAFLAVAALARAAMPAALAEAGMLGVLTPQRETALEPEIQGQLRVVHVRIGDKVASGDVVAELDSETIGQDLDEANARLEAVQAEHEAASTQLRIAEDALERRQRLLGQQAVSRGAVQAAQQAVELAAAEIDQAEASVRQQLAIVEQYRTRLRQTKMLAPFSGTIAERYVNPGMTVTPGRPVVRIISSDRLRVRFAAPVERAADLVAGRLLRIIAQNDGTELIGAVRQVGSEVDPASGMIICEGDVELPGDWRGAPLSGQAVRVWIRNGEIL